MTEGKLMDWSVFEASPMAAEACAALGIHLRAFAEVPSYRDALTVADVNRVMRLFEEDGRRERQRLAGRAKVRAALRQGRVYAANRKQWEDYWEHLPMLRLWLVDL